jgi:hypothetical protein
MFSKEANGDMGAGYNFQQLRENILRLSHASDWEIARNEWSLVDVHEAEELEICLCGHFPIIEICTISNSITKATTDVGNVCVRRFLGLRSDLIFNALKKIRQDNTKSLNAESIVFFHERSLLTSWEYGFLNDTIRKRNLTQSQLSKRIAINNKVLKVVAQRGFHGPD